MDPEVDEHLEDPEPYAGQGALYEYMKGVYDSEGFEAHDELLEEFSCVLENCPEEALTDEDDAVSIARSAVEEFNRLKGTNFVLDKVLRMTAVDMTGPLAYVTLACTDGRIYESKVHKPFWDPVVLYTFRPAKHYPSRNSDSSKDGVSPPSSKSGSSDSNTSGSSEIHPISKKLKI